MASADKDLALQKSKLARKTVRTSITKLINNIEALLKDKSLQENDLEDNLALLVQKEDDLNKLDQDVKNNMDDLTELEKDLAITEDYKDKIIMARSKAHRTLQKLMGMTSQASSGNGSTISLNGNGNGQTSKATTKLPTLAMQKFNGDITTWNSFWSQFTAAVDEKAELSKVEKLTYLISLLEGEAASVVDKSNYSDKAYDDACQILKDRFAREDLMQFTLMMKLLDMEPVHKTSDLKGLRKLVDSCESYVRSLKNLGADPKTNGMFLCPTLLRIVPKEIRHDYTKTRVANSKWDADHLLKFLRNDVDMRETTEVLGKEINNKEIQKANNKLSGINFHENKRNNDYNRNYNQGHKGSAAVLTTGIVRQESTMFCIFCKTQNHSSSNCNKINIETKRNMIRNENRCFNCLKGGHSYNGCPSNYKGCKRCYGSHNFAVCEKNEANSGHRGQGFKQNQNEPKTNKQTETEQNKSVNISTIGTTILLQTAKTAVINPNNQNQKAIVRCLLDQGSQGTFIKEEVSRKLNLPIIGEEKIRINTFLNEESKALQCRKVALVLENLREPHKTVKIEAIEVPYVCRSVTSVNDTEIGLLAKTKGLVLADEFETKTNDPSSIELLIGADYYWDLVPGNLERLGKALMAIETKLGWVVQGRSPIKGGELASYSITCAKISLEEREVTKTLKSLWELETLGINSQEIPNKQRDNEMIENFERETTFEEGRYMVKFPWKTDKNILTNNFPLAIKRFKPLIKKFQIDPVFFEKYKAVIEEQLEKGIVEEVKIDFKIPEKEGINYLPHQGVVNEQRATTKLRVVLDGSAHEAGKPSLNDCLETGPNLNPDLLLLLLRFRIKRIAIVADIEKAFLQVGLEKGERDAVRFLWVKENDGKIEPNQFRILRMTRVPFGVSSSPYLLAVTIKTHLKAYENSNPMVFEIMNRDLYYDDLVTGVDNVKQGIEVAEQSKEILRNAGMILRKWKSNSNELKQILGIENENEAQKQLIEKHLNHEQEKVLGINWNTNKDTFTYDLTNLIEFLSNVKKTKRCLLSALAQIFDPMGVLGPFTVRAKMLFQETWEISNEKETKLDWDDELPPKIGKEFGKWCQEMTELNKIEIPRYYLYDLKGEIKKQELHCFTDASMKAFAAVLYLRTESVEGQIHTRLITAKTRVAPLKNKLTITKLELTGCLIGARLVNYVKNIFENPEIEVTYWTDSSVALGWIKSNAKEWKPFVSNRVNDIQNISNKLQWKHCPGNLNAADLPTRGLKASELILNKVWWEGPSFLRKPSSEWPRGNPSIAGYENEIDSERRKMVLLVKPETILGIQQIIDLKKHSSLTKVIRITAYLLRFINGCRKIKIEKGNLNSEELNKAEKQWVTDIQSEDYYVEIQTLKQGNKVSEKSKIKTLNPFLDQENILRVGGRLEEANLNYNQKHPIILNKSQRLSTLLIRRSHIRMLHSGVTSTITDLRESYWITSGRQLTKTLLKKCIVCNKINAKAGKVQIAQLPKSRIIETPPFETIGLDFAGPLLIRTEKKKIMKKVYILLITCAVTRAVHLELVESMNTEQFLLAMTRFISRRGLPRIVYSDNAKTFKRAEADYKDIWRNLNAGEIQNYYGNEGITWRYIADRASWWGGMYERLVGVVKKSLKKVLGTAALTFSEMETVLTQTEAVVNSRPITFVYNEPNEPSPLTPAHFLIGRRLKTLPNRRVKENETISSSRKDQIIRWSYRQKIMNQMWKRWRTDYLMNLRSAHHIDQIIKTDSVFKTGDVVMVHDDKLPRQTWNIGVVTQPQPGRDGRVRSCLIKIANGNVIRRPVQLLYLLELPEP